MNDYQTKIQTLNSYGIKSKLENGKLYAEEVYTIKFAGTTKTGNDWVDVSEFTSRQLMEWLG